jgi:hypothetical protein
MSNEFEDVRDTLPPLLRRKIEQQEPLTEEEILTVKLIMDLGDTCGCDDTHHRKDYALVIEEGAKHANFSD